MDTDEDSSIEFNHLDVKAEILEESVSGASSGRVTPQLVSRSVVSPTEDPLGFPSRENSVHEESSVTDLKIDSMRTDSLDSIPDRFSSSSSIMEVVSEQLEKILEEPHSFQLFLNYLNEWHVDIDLLFVMQVDQLIEIAKEAPEQVMKEQFQRIYHKHISDSAELPLTQLPQKSLKILRKRLESS